MRGKKIFSVLLAVACITSASTMGMVVSAEDEQPGYKLTDKVDGNNVVVTLNFTDKDNVAAGNYTITYDTGVFELVSAVKGAAQADINTVNSKNAGQVKGNFMFTDGFVGESTDVVIVTLKMLNDSFKKDDIQLESYRVFDINSSKLADETTVEPEIDIDCAHENTKTLVTKNATCAETGV